MLAEHTMDDMDDFSMITPSLPNSYNASYLQSAKEKTAEPQESRTSRDFTVDEGATASGLPKFMGVKERRRSSTGKVEEGDYLFTARNPAVIKLMAKHGKFAAQLRNMAYQKS